MIPTPHAGGHPASAWAATAGPRPDLPPLSGDRETDVVVIGGGFTGLSTAHHLRKAGIRCVVLDAHDAGWGASGRNGGMAVLRLKQSYAALGRRHGDETARRLYHFVHDAVNTLEATVGELGIDCGFGRWGHITAANGRDAMAALEADIRWLEAKLEDRVPMLLSRPEMARCAGTQAYAGGYLDPRAAGIHPLDYARGLAAGVVKRGASVHAGTPVEGLQVAGDHVVARTPGGRVRASCVVFATNAYSDLVPLGVDLPRRIVPVSTSVIATAPIPEPVARAILPENHLVTDTRHLVNYFRWVPGRRLLYGGRGDITGRLDSPDIYRGLEAKLVETFPALAGHPIEFRWSGKVAVTLDDFPHIGSIGERIHFALGYGGRGVALTNLMGKLLAKRVQGELVDTGPMGDRGFRPIPFHAFRIPAMNLVAGYYKLRDRLAR